MIFTDKNHFRIFGNFLICFRKFDWKNDTRHSFLEIVAKSGNCFIKIRRNIQKMQNLTRYMTKYQKFNIQPRKNVGDFWLKFFEIEERCKGVHCVDLGESFPTSIYLMKSASIQPRTSPSKFGGKFNSICIRLLGHCPSSFRGSKKPEVPIGRHNRKCHRGMIDWCSGFWLY